MLIPRYKQQDRQKPGQGASVDFLSRAQRIQDPDRACHVEDEIEGGSGSLGLPHFDSRPGEEFDHGVLRLRAPRACRIPIITVEDCNRLIHTIRLERR